MNERDLFILNHEDEFEKLLKKFIALKSVSATGEGIEETVDFLQSLLEKLLQANVEIIQTAGNPVIFGKYFRKIS